MNNAAPKIAAILNPKWREESLRERWEQWKENQSGLHVYSTQQKGDAARLAARAAQEGAEQIIVVGGDGTLHEVVNGLAALENPPILGLIPKGTGNDFARTIGLETPEEDELGPALQTLKSGQVVELDLIELDGPPRRRIVNAATGGFSIRVAKNASDTAKKLLGPFAYTVAAIQSAGDVEDFDVDVTVDGESFSVRTPTIIIANGQFVAGGHHVAYEASAQDGLADVVIVTAESLLDRVRLLANYYAGVHLDSEDVIYFRAKDIRIESDPPIPFSLDGETMDGMNHMHFRILPNAIRMIVPKPRLTSLQ